MPTISAPIQNSILNDANLTEIIVEDTTVFSHYEANIYIDNILFDSVIMPKVSSQKMVLTFDNLLLKYITLPEVNNALSFQGFNLIRNLKITIARFLVGIAVGVTQYTLNYKLKYSVLPTAEKYETAALSFVGVDPETFLVAPNTKIQLPIFANSVETIMVVEAVTPENVVLSTITGYGSQSNGLLLLSLDVVAPPNVSAYFFKVHYAGLTIQKKFRVVRNGYYKPKRVRFYNRFGMPVLVELFGKLSAKDDQTYFKYQNGMGFYTMAEIQTDTQLSIDTGHLLDSEKAIVNQIASSLRVEIEINGVFTPCVATLKTIPVINENEFINSAVLTFEFNKSPKIKN